MMEQIVKQIEGRQAVYSKGMFKNFLRCFLLSLLDNERLSQLEYNELKLRFNK